MRRRAVTLSGLVVLLGLRAGQAAPPPALEVAPIESPAPTGSRWPELALDPEGGALLSWLQVDAEKTASLHVARHHQGGWQPTRLVATGSGWFVNWADFPTLAASTEGRVIATWLEKLGKGTYAYGVQHAIAPSEGAFTARGLLHSDRSETEHGFVSLAPLAEGRVHANWLDGRQGADGKGGAMALYSAELGPDGQRGPESLLDNRVCDCCQTSSVVLDDGSVLVAYRDRGAREQRDIAVVRGRRGETGAWSWSKPRLVHADGWTIAGCPVNGPALAVHGKQVAVAWFTAGTDGKPRALVALSRDRGERFSAPRRLDDGRPSGRLDLVFADPKTLVVTWLELGEETASWRARTIVTKGRRLGPSLTLATAGGQRGDGFLRTVALKEGVLAAWTDATTGRVETALVKVRR